MLEQAIDLVAEDPDAVLARELDERGEDVLREQRARRVVGLVQDLRGAAWARGKYCASALMRFFAFPKP